MSHFSIKRIIGFCAAIAAAFMAQACLLPGDDSSDGSGINGRWQLERIIGVYNLGEGVSLRDTAEASTEPLERSYLVINGTNFGYVTYGFGTERPDTMLVPATLVKGQKWMIGGDSSIVVRSGSVLRITMPWIGGEEEPDSIIREFSLYTAAFPPAAWVGTDTGTDTTSTGATHAGVWVSLSEVINGESITYDTTDPYDRFFLRFSGDDLYYIDFDGEFLMSDERTSATTWDLVGGSTLTITSVTSTRLNVRVVGTDSETGETFTSNAVFARYNGDPLGGGGGTEVPVDANEPNGSVTTATPLTVGASAKAAAIVPDDEDWYSFTAQSGTTYTIETFGSPADVYMILLSADGTEVFEENDDGGEGLNSMIVWQATATGKLNVVVVGLGDNETGAYSIRVTTGGLTKKSVDIVSEKPRKTHPRWR